MDEVLLVGYGEESSYEWSAHIIIKRNGRLFFAVESGCSCYGPTWEDERNITDYQPLRLNTFREALSETPFYTTSQLVTLTMEVNKLLGGINA